ncbi:cytochrome c biogenesis protein [bacterium]|nr:cytochrome c biogenesis protein [bacterium]
MNSSTLLGISTFVYLIMSVGHLYRILFKKPDTDKILMPAAWAALAVNVLGWIMRWIETQQTGHAYVPLSNMYEALTAVSWCVVLVYLLVERKYRIGILGVFIFPLVSLAMAYASLSPNVNQQIQPLIPALQSNWLTYHVLTCFLGYSAFTVSFGAAIAYLIKLMGDSTTDNTQLLDEIIYRANAMGFIMLTIGIITGSVWASRAWGAYWSWDPKETWSLITWIIYAIFLHARLSRDWRGKKAAILSIVGFCAVLFTFFGVNYLLAGLHSYA